MPEQRKESAVPDKAKPVLREEKVAAPPQEKADGIKLAGLGVRLAKLVFNSVVAVFSIIGVVSSVYEIGYAAIVTIDAPASDPKFAFEYPFKLINNSHVFTITDLKWECKYILIQAPQIKMENNTYIRGSISSLDRGGYGWLDCAALGPNSKVVKLNEKPEIKQAKLEISVSYKATLFFVTWPVSPKPTLFTWSADASNPQWTAGDLL